MPRLNPLFEREWRGRFRRPTPFVQLGALVGVLGAVLLVFVWRAGFAAVPSALSWRAGGKTLLDIYRVAAGLILWGGALLLGNVSVSDEKTGGTWEHLLLCPVGGRGLCAGKIASGAAFLGVLQLVLLPVLLLAGQCFGVAPSEIAGVMLSHLLLTIQGGALGFWGALRGQSLNEGLLESLVAIGRVVAQTALVLVVASWVVVLLGSALVAAIALSPVGVGMILRWALVAFFALLFWAVGGLISFVAGVTGVGVLAQSLHFAGLSLSTFWLWAGQLAGAGLFLKWSAWEVEYPTREFWGEAAVSWPTNKHRLSADTTQMPPKQIIRALSVAHPRSSVGMVPARKTGAPPLFGSAISPAYRPAPLPQSSPLPAPRPPVQVSSSFNQAALSSPQARAFVPAPGRLRVLYGDWSWHLSPRQLAAFRVKERREARPKSSEMLPTWEQTWGAPAEKGVNPDKPKAVRRMRAPISRRFQDINPVLWLDLSRCLSLRSPDSSMIPVLLTCGALGGAFVLAVGLFLFVGWIQNLLGGASGDVSSLETTWNNLHWALRWGALAFGPLWGATGYVVERRTGMLVELRLTLLSARAVWWGKFAARFGIFAALSLPLLAMTAFFAANWPGKNAVAEVTAATISSWGLASWSLLVCLLISDSCRKELAAGLWCMVFGLSWGLLGWNYPAFFWAPLCFAGALLAGMWLLLRLRRLGFS